MSSALAAVLTLYLSVFGGFEREVLVSLGEPENQVITPSGRHFISTGIGLFELVQGADGFESMVVGLEDCGVNGLAVLDDYLVAACNRGDFFDTERLIFVGKLVEGEAPILEEIFELPNFFIANGVAISPSGAILVADFPIFGQGEVVRLVVEDTGETLQVVDYDPAFLTQAEGIEAPNGLKVSDQDLFISDSGRVLKVVLGTDDAYVSTEVLYSTSTVFDDLTLLCGGVVVTDFLSGGLIFVDASGSAFETPSGLFETPTSVTFGDGPLYDRNDLLVTERGILGDPKSDIGNRVTRIGLPLDLLRTFCGLQTR